MQSASTAHAQSRLGRSRTPRPTQALNEGPGVGGNATQAPRSLVVANIYLKVPPHDDRKLTTRLAKHNKTKQKAHTAECKSFAREEKFAQGD